MSYRVELSGRAIRGFDALPADVRRTVQARLDELAENPRPRDGAPLKGALKGLWRLRAGDWRISFEVRDDTRQVRVVETAHRHSVYQRLRRKR